jgi:hypothetical protein
MCLAQLWFQPGKPRFLVHADNSNADSGDFERMYSKTDDLPTRSGYGDERAGLG